MTTISNFMSSFATLASFTASGVASLLRTSSFKIAMLLLLFRSPKSRVRFVACQRQPREIRCVFGRSITIHIDDSLGESLGCFLRKIVSDTAFEVPVCIFA